MQSIQATARRKKLLFIEPYPDTHVYRLNPRERKALWFPKLSLPTLAARTPDHWEIALLDESVDRIDFDVKVDLVGISAMTCYAPRAYEISKAFRARGVKVILGGVHPSFMPEEAIANADAVVIGEADEIWPKVLEDFEAGRLEKFYRMESFPDLDHYPHPRIDLLKQDEYMTGQCLMTTRGCHFDCEFCSVSPFNGKTSRRRPVAQVCEEIRRVKEWRRGEIVEKMTTGSFSSRAKATIRVLTGIEDGAIFAFVDDLHNSNRTYCKELWTALKDLNIKWGAQCTMFLGDEPDLMKLAADSGCVSMFVGLESIFEESIDETNKPFNRVAQYEKQIKCFHDHGVMLNPGVIFGFDNDDESVFERTVEFLIKNNMELAYFNILTPLPGTALFDRMKAEGRITNFNWELYDGKHVVYKPKRMSPEALQEGFFWANHAFFSHASILRRLFYTRQRLVARYVMNLAFRRLIKRTCPKGRIHPLAKIIQNLQDRLPSYETDNLIPNALHNLKEAVSGQIDRFLNVKARKNEAQDTLQVDLKGTLDQFAAKEIQKRLLKAAQKAKMDIVVNFEHLAHATPKALQTLTDKEMIRKGAAAARIKYMNLKNSFEKALDPALIGMEAGEDPSC
jgi:radical SAM superfamily enzyme YgiQ (UPF0313 family)